MLDIGFMEILVIGALALIVVGPKDLPGLLRTVGQYAGKARAMAREFQRTMEDAAREADLGDVADVVKGKKNQLPFGNQVVDSLKEFEKTVKSEVTEAQRAGEASVRSASKTSGAAVAGAAAAAETPQVAAKDSAGTSAASEAPTPSPAPASETAQPQQAEPAQADESPAKSA